MPSKHRINSQKTKKAVKHGFTQAVFAATVFHLKIEFKM